MGSSLSIWPPELLAELHELRCRVERLEALATPGHLELGELMQAIIERNPAGVCFTASELLTTAQRADGARLQLALSACHALNARAIGLYLARHRGQTLEGLTIERASRASCGRLWTVSAVL
jgi:hypothetical protein